MGTDDLTRTGLQNLSDLTQALSLESAGASQREVLESVLQLARVYAGPGARVALFLVDENSSRVRLATTEGLSDQFVQDVGNTPVAAESVPCCRAAYGGEKVIVEDVLLDPGSTASLEFARRHAIRGCWSFPVRGQRDTLLAVLAICFQAPQGASPRLVASMELLAQVAALSIGRHTQSEERRKAEAQLRESEARYRSLTQVLTSIVWTSDAQARFTAPQESWESYTGQSWERQRGFGWLQAVHPDDRERVLSSLTKALEDRNYYCAEGRLWHEASQTYRFCEARGMPIFGKAGEVTEWIGTCVDVDDYKRAEAALRVADRRKDEFIAVLAHELRNPLAPIRNAVHILKARGTGDVQLSWAATIIDRQVRQMARLLDDLLDVSRITREKLELRKTRLTLDSVLEAALETSRPILEQHGHHFELNVLCGPIYVEADGARLAQAFSNLLNNAAKYTDRGGKVSLTVRLEDSEVVVSVKDSGIGIEAEMLPKLFHMFAQASPALERAQGGLGIGLSLVRGLVGMHGGTVQAYSAGPGRGSEFVVRLPVAPARAAPVPQPDSTSPVAPPMRILVADDNRDAAETLSVFLQMMGHDVRTASDGQEAVEIAAAFHPAVALLDLGMPKIDGYAAATRIRALLPGVLLVAMTGWGQQDDMHKASAAGFDHGLVKPVNPETFGQLLSTLRSRQAQGDQSACGP